MPPSIRAALSSKLSPPAESPRLVARQAVWDRIRQAQSVKVVLFRAAAGFGKTTAMAQCRARFAEVGVATAWLTLDGLDNDTSRFLRCLTAAVGLITDEAQREVGAAPDGNRWAGDVALDLVDALAAHPAPFALFLDDFDAIQDPGALGLVREIIANLPRRGQLLVGSRTAPDLSLGRLRAREQLLEIDVRDLRFSAAETAEFFSRRRQAPLAVQELSTLHRKTEGWPAALSLVSVALDRYETPGTFIERFSGSNAAVAEYLADEVLAAQPPPIRSFLLRTSILRELHPAICGALLPRTDAGPILQQLERANLFLTPIAGDERRYRFHSLFATFLRDLLARELPAEVPRLHRAASRWYASQQRPVPAIDHALEARDFEVAIDLLTEHAEHLLADGRLRLLARWFDALPPKILRTRPVLQAIEVWVVALTRGPREASSLLQRSGCERSRDPAVSAYLLAIRPILPAMLDRYEEAHAAGRASLVHLPTRNQFANMAFANTMARILSVIGQPDDARRFLDDARRAQGERASAFHAMYSEAIEGTIDLLEGRLRQATARFRMALGDTQTSFGQASGNAWAGVLYASSVYEANDLHQAARLLSVYLPLASEAGLPDHMILGYRMLSRIAFSRGDVDEAFETLTELEYLGQRRQLPRVVAGAKLERARMLLRQGHAAAARSELDRADDRLLWERAERLRFPAHDLEYMALARLRWEVIAGDPGAALPSLVREVAAASSSGRLRRALKVRLLHAIALDRIGDERQAAAVAIAALRSSGAEGYVRLVVDEGESAAALVRRADARLREEGAHRRDPTFGEYLQRVRDAFGPGVGEAEEEATDRCTPPLEPLTPKEITVLELLAEGYSNSAMAEKLLVADTTIRTHLRNINGKLGARSRTHAVALARRLQIIA